MTYLAFMMWLIIIKTKYSEVQFNYMRSGNSVGELPGHMFENRVQFRTRTEVSLLKHRPRRQWSSPFPIQVVKGEGPPSSVVKRRESEPGHTPVSNS
jgi:hypothetical protein